MNWKPRDTVIVPIDFSASSAAAVREGLAWAMSPESVHVVHVIAGLDPIAPYGYWDAEDLGPRRKSAREHLDRFLDQHGFETVRSTVLTGDAGEMITEYANKYAADLIVMPSHGYHGLKRLLLGSTTERVIRHAHCPVYVLRRGDTP